MLSTERLEFDGHIASLCAALNMPATPERLNGFWKAFNRLHMLEIARMVEGALQDPSIEKATVPALWRVRDKLRHRAGAVAVVTNQQRPMSRHLVAINLLFFAYLHKRRVTEEFKGNLNLDARRKACLDLAEFFEQLDQEEDLRVDCTAANVRSKFASTMARIPDGV